MNADITEKAASSISFIITLCTVLKEKLTATKAYVLRHFVLSEQGCQQKQNNNKQILGLADKKK